MATIVNPEDKDLYFKISKVLNHTFGTTGPGQSNKTTQKVNLSALDNTTLKANYIGFVTFTTDKNLDSLTKKFRNEAYALIEASLQKFAKTYEKEHNSTLEFEINLNSAREDVEYLHYNGYNTVRRAFFKLNCLVNIAEK